MGTISVPVTYTTTATAANLNDCNTTIYNEFNGNIDNDNIKAAAAIAPTKLDLANGVAITQTKTTGNAVTISRNLTATSTAAPVVSMVQDHADDDQPVLDLTQDAATVDSLRADRIGEHTAATGVTIDGVLLKDSQVKTDTIIEKTGAAGVTIDSLLIKDAQVQLPAGPYTAASDGATVTFALATSRLQNVALGGNRTLALSGAATGMVFILCLTQDGTGSRTVTWFSTIRWAGGSAPTLTTTASKRDVFGFICTGENTYDGFVVGQNL